MADDYSDIISNFASTAPVLAATSTEDNPDDAARAVDLGKATGVPASVIAGDLDGFDKQNKSSMAAQIVGRNPQLTDYVNSHPLAAKVSNDDWGSLDAFTKAGSWFDNFTKFVQSKDPLYQAGQAFISGAEEGFGPGELAPEVQNYNPVSRSFWDLVDFGIRGIQAFGTGTSQAAGAFAGTALQDITGDQANANLFARDISGLVEKQMLNEDTGLVRPWMEARETPPQGVSKSTDAFRAEVNRTATNAIFDKLAAAKATTTVERSPDLFENFGRQQYGNATISFSGDSIAALYGDKVPTPDDGLLGWAPGIEDQLSLARDIGQDVHVPMAGFLTHMDPTVATVLRPGTLVWPEGLTDLEASEPLEPKTMVDAPLAQVRGANSLEPSFALGDRALTIQKAESIPGFEQYHEYNMFDDRGNPAGELTLVPDPENKILHVQMISGSGGFWSNSFGPALVRSVANQLKQFYPDFVGEDGKAAFTGHRVTGAREAAGTTGEPLAFPVVRLGMPDITKEDFHAAQDIFNEAYWRQLTPKLSAQVRPTELYTGAEPQLAQTISEELRRMGGKGFDILPVDKIAMEGLGVNPLGTYQPFANRRPYILYNLLAPDALGIARHEGVHLLRDQGLISPDDWNVLRKAAMDEGWLDKYGINDRYPPDKYSAESRIEESVAEAYRDWAGRKDLEPITTPYSGIFERIHQLWQNIRARVTALFGREPTFAELFQSIREGKFAGEGRNEGQASGLPQDLAPSFAIDRDSIRAQAMGVDKPTLRRLDAARRAREDSDIEAATNRAEAEQRRRQTAEWKDNYSAMQREVEATIRQRPQVAADLFLGSGEFYGRKIQQRFTLRASDLTDEQRASLPDHYVSAHGLPADDVAHMFGYQSGDAMVEDLAKYNAAKSSATPQEALHSAIKSETDRQMEARYGNLGENIMTAARDQALSEASLNELSEEHQAAAMRAGVAAPSKADVRDLAEDQFGKMRVGNVNSTRLMGNVARLGRVAERAADDDPMKVQALQKKLHAGFIAADAAKLDKERAAFDKLAKQMARIKGGVKKPTIDPEYVNWIQDILGRAGQRTGRLQRDIQADISARTSQTLADFVNEKFKLGRDLSVPEFMLDPAWGKDLDDLSVNEFRDLHNAIKSLVANGRNERKIDVGGEARDLDDYRTALKVETAQGRVVKDYDVNHQRWVGPIPPKINALREHLIAIHVSIPDLLDRFDHWDPGGLWAQGPIRNLIRSAQARDAMIKRYAAKLRAIDTGDLSKSVDNDIFRKPESAGGQLISGFTRKNLLAVMLNRGTKENLHVLTGGYNLTEGAIEDWVNKHATEQDWNTVKAVWKTFADMKAEGDTMYRSIGSFGISSKRGVTFQTPFGEVEGGYYPLIRNSEFGGEPKAVREGLFENNYTAATPPASYTKRVTGAVYPLELTIDALPNRLMQEIHDISMRPALIDAAKVFMDTGVRNTISAHFGPEMADLLRPYLKDIANRANNIPGIQGPTTELLGSLRHNLITSIVGLGTFAKHTPTAFVASMGDVPPGRFLKALVGLVGNNLETGETNFRFAMENSNELPRRKFNAEETIHGAHGLAFGQSGFRSLQQTIREWSSKPYMLGDLLSAIPLWNAKYEMGREAGLAHGDAVYEADRAVQRAHGSTLITNRPAVVRNSNPWFTSLYNFYSNMVNRHMETVWRAGEEVGAANSPYASAKDKVLDITGRTFAYAIWPAIVEQLVSPIGGQNDSWEKKAALALGGQFASGWIGIRDLAGALIRGDDPSAGLTGTGYEYGTEAFKDLATALSKGSNPRRTRAIINSAINLGGLFTGMVPAPLGNLAKFEYGVATGVERPVGLWSWLVGTRFGTMRHHSSTFQNYREGRPY